MSTFKRGDKVTIISQTMSGQFRVEGKASVVLPADNPDDMALVRFLDDPPRHFVRRFIDPAAQDDPDAFVAALNDSLR